MKMEREMAEEETREREKERSRHREELLALNRERDTERVNFMLRCLPSCVIN